VIDILIIGFISSKLRRWRVMTGDDSPENPQPERKKPASCEAGF
jgi:hypothetical protein